MSETKKCPMCGKEVEWKSMVWLAGKETCQECYKKRKAAKKSLEIKISEL